MTVVFDAGQNSEANFAYLAGVRAALHRVSASQRLPGPDRPARLQAHDRGQGPVRRADRLRHPPYRLRRRAPRHPHPLPGTARDSQACGFDGTTLAKAGKKLDELAATLARGKTRRPRDKVEAEITAITSKPWVRRVIRWQLTGDQPKDLRLTWHADPGARAALEEEIFGKIRPGRSGQHAGLRGALPARAAGHERTGGERSQPAGHRDHCLLESIVSRPPLKPPMPSVTPPPINVIPATVALELVHSQAR